MVVCVKIIRREYALGWWLAHCTETLELCLKARGCVHSWPDLGKGRSCIWVKLTTVYIPNFFLNARASIFAAR